jgi:hypothetical protein
MAVRAALRLDPDPVERGAHAAIAVSVGCSTPTAEGSGGSGDTGREVMPGDTSDHCLHRSSERVWLGGQDIDP